jgi:hypothetical protein
MGGYVEGEGTAKTLPNEHQAVGIDTGPLTKCTQGTFGILDYARNGRLPLGCPIASVIEEEDIEVRGRQPKDAADMRADVLRIAV